MSSDVLIGVAIDVSGSMRENIRNDAHGSLTRLKSVRETLSRVSDEARIALARHQAKQGTGSADVFAYAFGLKELAVADLVTLVQVLRKADQASPPANPPLDERPQPAAMKFADPFQDLEDQAVHWDVPGWGLQAKDYLSRDEALNLARLLRQNPREAEQLAEKIKKDGSRIKTAQTLTSSAGVLGGRLFGGAFGGALGGMVAGRASRAVVNSQVSASLRELIQKMARAQNPEEARAIAVKEYLDSALRELANTPGTTVPLTEINEWVRQLDADSPAADQVLYGKTPFCAAMDRVIERFRRELICRNPDTRKILFLISDGEPTDGDPRPRGKALNELGVGVASCFVTGADLVEPRRLYSTSGGDWSKGARLMFDMASKLEENSSVAGYLREVGWDVPAGAKLFAQINHSEVLNRFVDAVFKAAADLDRRY
jgi:hypothetical protein